MAGIWLDDEELDALEGAGGLAVQAYLTIRRRMDRKTWRSGVVTTLSWEYAARACNALPFYPTNSNYVADEINEEDIRFIIWNTWQKAASLHEKTYINPNEHAIEEQAGIFYGILEKAYENAPEMNP